MQIVVTQHGDGAIAERFDESQRGKRGRPPIDQVADEPEPVPGIVEVDQIEQTPQRLVTALNVTDRVDGHQWTMLGTDNENTGIGTRKRSPPSASNS